MLDKKARLRAAPRRRVASRPPPLPGPPGAPPHVTPERVSRYEVPSKAHERLGLWVSSVGRHVNQGPQTFVRDRVLECYAGVLITRGEGFYESAATGRVSVRAGTLLWVLPGVPHSYSAHESRWDEHWVVFGGRVAEAFERQGLILHDRPVVNVGANAEVVALFERMLHVFLAGGPLAVPMAAGLAYQLVVLAHGLSTGFLQRGPSADPAVGEAVRIIERDATRSVQPRELAQGVHVGYSTLRRRFRSQTGFSIKEYILRVQLRHAKELLAATRLSVDEIARACGFEDALYFSRMFKQKTGLPPTQFRVDEWRTTSPQSLPNTAVTKKE
ncbi:MAG: helix-turn-helix transcriptional regulator [Planctomycetes bacterium]|nr:helix-turn-helix transcriptional regulator [Planctomycetota bacterium]